MFHSGIAAAARRIIGAGLRTAAGVVVSSLVSVALVASTVGCFSLRAPVGPLKVGQTTRLEFAQAVSLDSLVQTQTKDTTHLRPVLSIEGKLVGATTDSVRLLVKRTFPTVYGAYDQIIEAPRSPSMRIQQRQFSVSRTALLLLGIGAVVAALAAWIASEMDFGPGSVGGY